MNLQQICRVVISAFVLLQELTRRAEILVHLYLPSAFLAVRLGVYGVAVCEQISLSPPLPKGRGRGMQIHAPRPGQLGFYVEQRFDHVPRKKMDVSGISLSIGIPCVGECKNNSEIRHTQKDAGGSLLQCAVSRQGILNIGSAQSMLLQDVCLSGMAA
ncbi:MAG: hypothetical protein H6857_03045 [Rhodospirillales bacterium]|nr:hypothetical protein [Rhodospirillales bacterium]